MAALLLDIQPGDEVIMPSYTFVSTANAFVLRGAKIVFVDVRPDTVNIDETLIGSGDHRQNARYRSRSITRVWPAKWTPLWSWRRSIICLWWKMPLRGVMSTYKGRALGTIGHIGCFSFHETKNYTAGGEGGATLINDKALIETSRDHP